ncbi:unnamed protein product [Blepharisma stoltei]|uniref:Glutaredoxin-like protein n=1 Tax=Blepharisma stoltei TaxID=1481888 RepID=A0AAU9ITY4_9CILI|nr:unnamed protein product [Blepharisma stoltei]
MINIELLVKRCCAPCHAANFILSRVTKQLNLTYSLKPIDSDSSLLRQYKQKVPVIRVNGEEIACLKIRESEVREKLISLINKP